ncbi:MAG: short-chain dehydrogenase, partial [Betaproteobacteria bacterium]|nr:short-chain dehydrogenase [Betaproteobacteria bacterium]
MDLGLKGRTALVTGGSRGLGLGVAQLLAAEGCNVHLASRSATDLENARKRIMDVHDVEVTCHATDLGQSENVHTLAKACFDVDILVNNAGAIPQGTVTGLDEQTWRTAWDLKVFGF